MNETNKEQEQKKQTKIITRIKKCLALSQSLNEFEAKKALDIANSLIKKHNIHFDLINHSYMNDENKHRDICKERSTYELYIMWQNSAIGSERAYMLEKIIKHRTDKWIDELEEDEFKNLKVNTGMKLTTTQCNEQKITI